MKPVSRTGQSATSRRLMWGVVAASIAAVDLGIKAWAASALSRAPINAGIVDLRLAHNAGAAFSIASGLPSALILAITVSVTVVLVVVGWRVVARASRPVCAALAAIVGGALANVIDRVPDGLVTDYLHTGWWPTFNLADSSIVVGVVTLALSELLQADPSIARTRKVD